MIIIFPDNQCRTEHLCTFWWLFDDHFTELDNDHDNQPHGDHKNQPHQHDHYHDDQLFDNQQDNYDGNQQNNKLLVLYRGWVGVCPN